MVHLRIADMLADELKVNLTKFIIGNLAPDSGEILNDGSYAPPPEVTHWKTNHLIQPDDFYKVYLISCNHDDWSFYLGYYSHLVTDYYWHELLVALYDHNGWIRHDDKNRHNIYAWNYTVDMTFLRKHPEMRALKVLTETEKFENTYLNYFGKDAIIRKMKDISKVYINDFIPEDESEYITTAMIDLFVNETVERIRSKIRAFDDDPLINSAQALR